MPLRPDDPCVAVELDALDHAVGSASADPQAVAGALDRLMVVRRARRVRDAHRGRQPGTGLDLDVVDGRPARDAGLAVGEDPVAVGDVLVERAAQRDVQHLVAAADRQRRDTAIDGSTCERELETVPVRDDPVDLVAPLLAVLLGVEVAAAHQ